MTSQPPPVPGGSGQPGPGAQPPQQPQPGQQPYGQQAPPAQPWGQPSQQQPAGGGGPSVSFDPKRLKLADYVIAGGSLVYLVFTWFTWFGIGGGEFFGIDLSVSGWSGSDNVKFAFFLFVLASAWALLPAFAEVKVGFPRSWITVGLAALGLLLTLFAWFDTFDFDFSIWALLGVLTAVAIVLFAVLSLVPELRSGSALPGSLSSAADWANRPGPGSGRSDQPGNAPGEPGQPGSTP